MSVVVLSTRQVREYHREWREEGQGTRDVVIVAHGHFNRCLIARWIDLPLSEGARPKYRTQRLSFIKLAFTGTKFNVEPAGVGDYPTHFGVTNENRHRFRFQIAILSYNHDSLQEPALNALNLNAF